ncbi:MAG TPA: glycoside hydrolase family 31 protein, partial [Vicinamibacteria bacterium]|nr:glycoside hydrolase family 31 protein [Vicinamibacteria bacterium]
MTVAHRRRHVVLAALVVLLSPAARAAAGWSSLESMPAPRREGSALVFQSAQGTVAVSALTPSVVRVRFAPGGPLGRDHSYAILNPPAGDPAAQFEVTAATSILRTSALRVTITHSPFRIAIASADGQSLDEDDARRGISFAGHETRVWKRLRDDEHVYGLGEKGGELDKRGRYRGGYSYAMWNSDTYAYTDDTDPLYVSVPFYVVLRQGRAHGIFLDNTFRTSFDIGKEDPDALSFGAVDGALDYYFIDGPTPKDVVQRYTELTGRVPLPPMWALGYNQCRYSYYPEAKVRNLADTFRLKRIPADVIWLDIHYEDGYNPFTWDHERFPDPGRMIRDLRQEGFRVVTIVDPHPKAQPGWPLYESGLAANAFVKNPDGSVYKAAVWPSQGEKNPGPSVFPDFTKASAREWWGTQLKAPYVDLGVAGIWNDMNEPAVFTGPLHTMALDARHDGDGQATDEREIHNVYGQLNARATFEGLSRLRPDERPFVLTRASYAGGQRWSAVWPGDNVSDWSALRATIPMFSNLGLSGFAFLGADIGGFAEVPSAELFTRWLQTGVFYPFMRTHTTFGTPDQEPWSYGTRHEAINRRAIEMRYQLLPEIYTVMEEASRTGVPALRPLLLEYPDDEATYQRQDEFLFGRDLLIAPVLREGQTEREIYFPKGTWYEYESGGRVQGGRTVVVPVTLDAIPVFVRGGAIVFRQPVVQHTGEMAGQALRLLVTAEAAAEGSEYEDDGHTLAHQHGASLRRRFTARGEGAHWTLEAAAPEGSYRPAARDLEVTVRGFGEPASVTLGGQTLAHLDSGAGAGAATGPGWTR